MTLDVRKLRELEFPWALSGKAIYLNTASTGPLPRRSVAALARFNELRSEPHLITHEIQFGTLDRSRELLARLIGASVREIALTTNTGFGINVAAQGLPLGRGDVVLGFEQEFPANVYPWMAAARTRGYEFRLLPLTNGLPSEQVLYAAMEAKNVKAVAISWVEFASGYRFDLAAIGAECRRRGILLVVDAIQGLGPALIDVHDAKVDVFAGGAQKWLLSPWGTGFVYVRDELIGEMEPGFVSWLGVREKGDFSSLVDYDMTWRDDARRFEFLTLPFQDFAGMNASLELFFEIGLANIERATRDLADRIFAWASRHGVEAITPEAHQNRAGIVALRMDNCERRSEELARAGVVHSLREGAIRLAPYFFNTADEIDAALAVLEPRGESQAGPLPTSA